MISRHYLAWCIEQQFTGILNRAPVQNRQMESFNGRFRDECVNTSWFTIDGMRARKSRSGAVTTTRAVRTHSWVIGRRASSGGAWAALRRRHQHRVAHQRRCRAPESTMTAQELSEVV